MERPASLLFFAILLKNSDHSDSNGLMVQSCLNQALYGHSFLNISGITQNKCLEHCLANCLCLSFQVCGNADAMSCQLCSSNKYLKPQAMRESRGCTSFNFGNLYEVGNQQCGRSCMSGINCCMTSNICANGGTCLSPMESGRKRFRCKCPDGYGGERCEVKQCESGYTGENCGQLIKSCRGYRNGGRVPGNYTVFDVDMNPFKVFCDFDRNSFMTWTLIQSYRRDNAQRYSFISPLFNDTPANQNDPSWFRYRLSKSRMESIQHDSSKWRITCRYDTDGVVRRDYARGAKTEMNILAFNDGNGCIKMEYIDVRGHNCTSCTANWRQKIVTLHFNMFYAKQNNCDFLPSDSPLLCGEDNFGNYNCTNTQHRCSSSGEATTQTWLGGDDLA